MTVLQNYKKHKIQHSGKIKRQGYRNHYYIS
jgi:hypothetical protein